MRKISILATLTYVVQPQYYLFGLEKNVNLIRSQPKLDPMGHAPTTKVLEERQETPVTQFQTYQKTLPKLLLMQLQLISYPFHSSSSLDTMKHSVLSYDKQNTYPQSSPSLVLRLALHSYHLNLFLCSLLPNQQEQDSHHHSCVGLLIEIPLESPPS